MKWELVADSWPEFANLMRRRWPELSDMQSRAVDGRRALLVDYLQETYCLSRDSADREVDDWIGGFGDALDEENSDDNLCVDSMLHEIAHAGQSIGVNR